MERYVVYQEEIASAAFRLHSDAFDYMNMMKEKYPSLEYSIGLAFHTESVWELFESKKGATA